MLRRPCFPSKPLNFKYINIIIRTRVLVKGLHTKKAFLTHRTKKTFGYFTLMVILNNLRAKCPAISRASSRHFPFFGQFPFKFATFTKKVKRRTAVRPPLKSGFFFVFTVQMTTCSAMLTAARTAALAALFGADMRDGNCPDQSCNDHQNDRTSKPSRHSSSFPGSA